MAPPSPLLLHGLNKILLNMYRETKLEVPGVAQSFLGGSLGHLM